MIRPCRLSTTLQEEVHGLVYDRPEVPVRYRAGLQRRHHGPAALLPTCTIPLLSADDLVPVQ